jgi:hypothetical protein
MDGAEPLVIGKGGGKEGQHGSTGTPPEASQHGFGLDMGRRLAQADQESLLAQVRELQAKVEALEKA